jgi:hypothetical protein
MIYSLGQQVTVNDCDGRPVTLRIWKDLGATVMVASDEVLRQLETGKTTLLPIGFRKGDVSPVKKSSKRR